MKENIKQRKKTVKKASKVKEREKKENEEQGRQNCIVSGNKRKQTRISENLSFSQRLRAKDSRKSFHSSLNGISSL